VTSTSTNYQATEMQFGNGSSVESCSEQYCARASIGSLSANSSQSASGSATFEPISSDEPLLEVIVEMGESNLGVLSTEQTATQTTVVKVRNYLSGGYTLQVVGNPPEF